MTLVYLSIAWACGIVLARWLWDLGLLGCGSPSWPYAILVAAGAGCVLLLRHARRPRLIAALALFAILGSWRYQAHPLAACPTPTDLSFYNGDAGEPVNAIVTGIVAGYPDVRDRLTQYQLLVDSLIVDGEQRSVRGVALLQVARYPAFAYGDRLRVAGLLTAPPVFDDFDYRAYLAQRGIHSILRRPRVERIAEGQGSPAWSLLHGLRARGAAVLNAVLPEPAAALGGGILLGIRGGIPAELDEAFKATGTAHINVISGSNISLLSGITIALLGRWLGRRRALFPTIACIGVYVLLVGAEAAAVRAGLMGILYVLAIYLGRQNTAYVSLCAAALLMTLHNPLTLWDVGFQLSFMATLGLTLFTPGLTSWARQLLERLLEENWVRRAADFLHDALIATLAAQITLLPLLVFYFGRLSPVSLLANFLILPAQPAVMAGGLATLVAGLIWEPAGRVLAVIPWMFLSYTTAIVRLAAAIPGASLQVGEIGRALIWVYYAVLFGVIGWRQLRRGGRLSEGAWRAAIVAGAVVLPLWPGLAAIEALPDGRLHVVVVPGAEGDAVLVVTPQGNRAWIWDGKGDVAYLAGSTRPLLPGWRPHVEVVIGPDAAAVWPGAQAVDPRVLAPGATILLDGGLSLKRLDADRDWAWLLCYEDFRTILPAGLAATAQAALVDLNDRSDLRITVLTTAGSQPETRPSTEFLAATSPQLIVWPSEAGGSLAAEDIPPGFQIARVPPDAIVEVITDGARVWLRTLGNQDSR